ncbi:MAG: helix-turn-helix domain-containing protein [Anaerolineae bacterium]|nr:helix-turn-helix domain-containing protein [Anaerolineae bacterium]
MSKNDADLPDRTAFQDWITPREAADLIGVTPHHIRHLARKSIITGRKFGHAWMIERTSAETYAATEHRPGPKTVTPNESD